MDIFQVVNQYISTRPEIVKVVGSKIYPINMPQNCILPAVVYSPILAKYDSALQGDTGYARQSIQFNCHATTFKQARQISRMIKTALQDYHGDMFGMDIQAVFIKSDFQLDSNTSLKFDTGEVVAVIEFEIHYNEK